MKIATCYKQRLCCIRVETFDQWYIYAPYRCFPLRSHVLGKATSGFSVSPKRLQASFQGSNDRRFFTHRMILPRHRTNMERTWNTEVILYRALKSMMSLITFWEASKGTCFTYRLGYVWVFQDSHKLRSDSDPFRTSTASSSKCRGFLKLFDLQQSIGMTSYAPPCTCRSWLACRRSQG